MKVVALFQLYLPYFLPRTPQWSEAENFQFQFEVEGHLVNIHPRRVDEKLFPTSMEEQLEQATCKLEADVVLPVDAPTEISVADRCLDRIEAQVYGEVASPEDCKRSEVTFAYRRCAISACNKFLYHCRVAGRDPDIKGLVWHYSFDYDWCYFTTPYSLIWFDAESKQPLLDSEGHELWKVVAGFVRSPVRLPVEFDLIEQSFDAGDLPDLPAGLLVSAKERLIVEQLHEGIINLASACEIASTRYIERKGMSGDLQVKAILAAKNHSFAERRFHQVTSHIDGRSLKTEDANAFSLLEKAYLTRNKLVHTGELVYKDSASRMITVTRVMAIDFFRGCERAVEWINKL